MAIKEAMHERTVHSETAFEGRLVRVEVLDVELDGGRRTVREIIKHPGAVVILAQLPDKRFVLVRQYRKAVETALLEVVAGTLEPGEDPEACARRELEEETGYHAAAIQKLGVIYPSPGYSDEAMHVYFAALAPEQGALRTDDDERLEVELLTADELDAMAAQGEMRDAKTLATWALYGRRK